MNNFNIQCTHRSSQLLVQSEEGIYRESPSGSAQVASENSNVVHIVVVKGNPAGLTPSLTKGPRPGRSSESHI